MKKNIAFIMLVLLLTSCTQNQKTNEEKPGLEIGSALMDGTTEMTAIVAGETSNQEIWLKYIQAHNDKNLDIIAEINADDWEGYTADGSVVKGNEAHIEILDNWFKNADPKWEVKWMIANKGEDDEGVMQEFLTTGNDITFIDEEGNEVVENHIHDVMFNDGKIKTIYVYSKPAPSSVE